MLTTAFKNADGATVLIALNSNATPATFRVQMSDMGFDYTLPAGAAATFVWKP